jgi:ABC-type multidrug transport system fused ATPase/permease subunit
VVIGTALFGLCSSLAEGIGLSLFIPLLRGLDQTQDRHDASQRFISLLSALFSDVPEAQRVTVIAIAIFAAVLLRSALSYATQLFYAALDNRIGQGLRAAAFEQLLAVDFGYWEQRASDKLFSTLAEDTWRTTHALRTAVFLVITICTLAVYLTVLVLIDWKMTLLVSCALLGFQALTRTLTRRGVRYGRLFTRANSALTKRMIETFQGMKVIRSFGRERFEQERFERASDKVGRALFATARVQAVSGPLLELLAASTVVALLVTASARHQDLSALLVFLLILYRLQAPVRDFANAIVALGTFQASVEQLTRWLRPEGKRYAGSGPARLVPLEHGVRLERVSFTYPGADAPALREVSAFLPRGRISALVGPSGSGKSTFVKLLQRLYDPDAGAIWFDDRKLSELQIESLRRGVAAVSQDVFLFDTTIESNIAYGRPEASFEEIVAAAKQADAHDFISALPAGYRTRVGERGAALSGGQAQRIALARAIIAKPELLILDEATNALDGISEGVVRDALDALEKSCTIVIVAHRFSTIERAENILVLERGEVREQGTYAHLLRKGSLFARLHGREARELSQAGAAR